MYPDLCDNSVESWVISNLIASEKKIFFLNKDSVRGDELKSVQ